MQTAVKIRLMFTGLIQAVGHIERVKASDGDITISINAQHLDLNDIKLGDSIAVNGVCLTATAINATHFSADVSKETLSVTTGLDQGGLNQNNAVNLEPALRLSDKLGGHLVSGHVDGIGVVTQFNPVNDCWLLAIKAPHAISKYIARKGSICVDGVSLTVNTIEKDVFTMNIIPHTIEKTTLGLLKVGSQVNLEIDQIARYIERMQQWEKESQ